MNDIIFEALKLLIMVCVAVIARYVIPWLKSRIEQDKMAAIEKMVTQAVLYAQQVLTSKSGAEKKAIVTDLLKEMLTAKNISITDEQLNILIEAAVKQMKMEENAGIVIEAVDEQTTKTEQKTGDDTMSLKGNSNEERIWNFLISKGLNPFGVAGLMGNLDRESGLSPINLQNTYEKILGFTDDTYTTSVDNGDYQNFVHDKAGYGIAQWTYWSRKQNLQKYAQEKGASIGDLEMQLEFLIQELSSSYKSVLNVLKTATSVSQASNAVLLNFEKPANQGSSVQKERAECGQKFYDKYASGKGGTSIMGKTITTGWLSAVINGIKIKSDLRCNLDNYSSRSSRDASYVTMHYTGNNKDTARANANYFGGAGRNASAHLFVDDTEIYQSVPLNSVAWHCGAQTYKHAYCRNANSIGIEMCCTAGNYKISEKTKQNAAYLCAYICKMLGISAGEVDKYVLRHWDVTGKNCPAQMAGSNNAEWVAFKNMVKSILNGGGTGNSTSGGTQTKQMYRVRKTWADAASQKGAFTSLENAKKCADENKGYSVFDSNGNKVYPASANTGTSCNYVVKITVDGLRYRDNPGTSGTKVLGYLKKNYKYTVVEERTVNGVKWGKLKSGAGWFSLQSEYSVRC